MDVQRPESIRLDLLGESQPLRQVRRFVRLQAERAGLEEYGEDAALVTTELLEGAGEGLVPAAVGVDEVGGQLVVNVDLRGPSQVDLREHTLALLSQLTAAWGWQPVDEGVRVWGRLPAAPADAT